MSQWFGRGKRRVGQVDWARHVKQDTERADQTLWALVAINVAVFVLWTQAQNNLLGVVMAQHFLVSADAVFSGRVWTLVTAEFSHIDTSHLLFNLLGLYVFGRDVARAYGWRALLVLYFGGAIAASAGHVLFGLLTGDPSPALGASGAVMSLAVVFGALFPNRTLLIGFFLPVPAAVAVAGFILLDVFGLFSTGSPVAHAAHLGGAAFGFAYYQYRTRQ